jgi:diaminopimelate decarboxylase
MQLENNAYQIQKVSLLDVCQEHGTPLYIYDADKIVSQYKRLTKAFAKTNVKVKYACKALVNINVLKLLKDAGSGLDAVSIQEVELGLKAGFAAEDILYTPNCVSFEEIKMAVDLGVHVNIDNISMLEQFGNHYGDSFPVCVRINPHIVAGAHAHIQTGHIDSKFGISIHQLRHVQRVVKTNNLQVRGLHMHTGSDILDSSVFLNAMEVMLDTAIDFKDLDYIDFGSGFKVAYREGDVTTDVEDLGESVAERFNEFCKEYGRDLEIWFEPGKYLVSEAGYFCARVNVVKQTTSTLFAGIDAGFNHLIRPMFYDSYHQITNISNPGGVDRVYTVVGYICETDTFGLDRKIAEVQEGNILAFHNSGAYGFAMASNYNSRLRPAEVMIKDGQAHLIRKREVFEDLTRNVVEIG